MSAFIYGVQYRCDVCGETGTSPDTVETGLQESPRMPDGWTDLGLTEMRDPFGMPVRHLCHVDSVRSFGAVIAELNERLKAKANGDNH